MGPRIRFRAECAVGNDLGADINTTVLSSADACRPKTNMSELSALPTMGTFKNNGSDGNNLSSAFGSQVADNVFCCGIWAVNLCAVSLK